ncbi:MAG: cytochrome c [Deltaproteobacteria bacterium]|nr:cytochrome c [Deltaproteobacteria bacterium]
MTQGSISKFVMTIAVAVAVAMAAQFAFGPVADAAGLLGDAAKGAAPYKTYCFSCHGEKGDGNGPAGAALNPKPRAFTDKAYMSGLTDEQLLKVITDGGAAVGKSPLMAPWKGTLKDQEIKDVAAYVRAVAK